MREGIQGTGYMRCSKAPKFMNFGAFLLYHLANIMGTVTRGKAIHYD
jgi:hypothetical protein